MPQPQARVHERGVFVSTYSIFLFARPVVTAIDSKGRQIALLPIWDPEDEPSLVAAAWATLEGVDPITTAGRPRLTCS